MDISCTDRRAVLYVEDDPNDVVLLRRAFERAELTNPLHHVADGERAMAYLQGHGEYTDRDRFTLPSLLIVDMKMPRTSGLEFIDWLKKQPRLARIPCVVLSSSRQDSDVNRAYDLGVNSYLVKPNSFGKLVELIRVLGAYWFSCNHAGEDART